MTGERRRYNPVTGSVPESATHGAVREHQRLRNIRDRVYAGPQPNLNFMEGLEGAAAAPSAARGGDQAITTLGVNWFPNPNIKVMLNYLMIDVDRLNPAGLGNTTPFGAAPNTPPVGVQIGQDSST